MREAIKSRIVSAWSLIVTTPSTADNPPSSARKSKAFSVGVSLLMMIFPLKVSVLF